MTWRIPLARPEISESDRAAVLRVLDSGQLSLGPEGPAFEEEFVDFLGGGVHAAAVSSGTAGLYLALVAAGVTSGVVLTPSYGFVGAAHAIRLAGAEPRFVEIDPTTLCVTADTLEAAYSAEVRAVMPVDAFGTPAPMVTISEWAQSRQVVVVEDACEAIGGIHAGQPVGRLADFAVFAFYPNKQMTTGEGGMVVSTDAQKIERIRRLRNQGRSSREFDFDLPGFNFRLTDLQAALGRSQLAQLPELLERRATLARQYTARFAELPEIQTLSVDPEADQRSWFVYVLITESPSLRDSIRAELAAHRIQTAPYFRPIHQMLPYAAAERIPNPLCETENIASRSFAIPFYPSLKPDELSEVADRVEAVCGAWARPAPANP